MNITSIEKNKKNNRYRIHIDNHFAFSISEEDYLKYHIYDKQEMSEDELNVILEKAEYEFAKSVAVRFLVMKQHSEKEVYQKLTGEGIGEKTILDVIDELKSIGYINDRIYTQKFLFDRSKLKPKSKKLLKAELFSKGISEEIIDEELSEWQIDEYALAENLIKKKFGKYKIDESIIRKMQSFLLHRGFSYDIIDTILKKIIN